MPLAAVALAAVLIGGLAVVLVQAAWRYVVEFEADFVPPGLKTQLMHRKSDALQDAVDAVLRGRLDRVEPAVNRIASYTEAIEGFLRTDVYERYGGDYRRALESLREAARRQDPEASKAAILRVESACIDCHVMINRR